MHNLTFAEPEPKMRKVLATPNMFWAPAVNIPKHVTCIRLSDNHFSWLGQGACTYLQTLAEAHQWQDQTKGVEDAGRQSFSRFPMMPDRAEARRIPSYKQLQNTIHPM